MGGARRVFRQTTLRMYLAPVVLAGALVVGAGLWMENALFTIDPGKGTALGYSVRTDRHVATLIQTLEPYVPSLDRNHGNDRYSVSLFLVPLDGSDPRLILLRSGLANARQSVAVAPASHPAHARAARVRAFLPMHCAAAARCENPRPGRPAGCR